MANMFRETAKHKSPVSVEDSVKTDKVISELWSWCSGVETLGMILFVILIIIGIITSIIAGFEPDGTSYYGEVKYKFNFGTFFMNLVDAAICAFIEYCIYHVVALLIGSLASITQHTKATAKLLEYQLSKDEPVDVANGEIGVDNTSSQRFCENCVTEISEDANFCPNCGTKQTGKVYR